MTIKKHEIKCSESDYMFIQSHTNYYLLSLLNVISALVCMIFIIYCIIYNHDLGDKYINISFIIMVLNCIFIYLIEKYLENLKKVNKNE